MEQLCKLKIDHAKEYKNIPDIIDKLAKLWRLHSKYHKQSFPRIQFAESGSQIKLMGGKCPAWLKQISGEILAYCFEDQVKMGGYKIEFAEVDVVALLVILYTGLGFFLG